MGRYVFKAVSNLLQGNGLGRREVPHDRLRIPRNALAVSFILGACGGSDTSGPDPVEITYPVQPTTAVAGASIVPAVQVATNSDARQTVSLSIADNICGAALSGVTSRQTVDGVATFPGLALDIPADDFRLEARAVDRTTRSAPFDVLPADLPGPLTQHASVCLRDHERGDAASLAWVSLDDVMWTADDNQDRICGFDRTTGSCLNTVTEEEIVEMFPGAGDCDDGDGDPSTTCSYTAELEVVAYDPGARFLYIFNTVNDPGAPKPIDRPAVFRFRTGGCRGCLSADGWKPLPLGYTYRSAVVFDGHLYISSGPSLYAYDYDANAVSDQPALSPFSSTITGLSSRQETLYAVTHARLLFEVDWDEDDITGAYDIAEAGMQTLAGVSVVRDSVYILEGEIPNPVFVFTIDDGS